MADNDFMATGYLAKIKAEMEERLGCKIVFVEDKDSSYPCKIEYARNYARQHHVLRVNPARCINAYPIFFVLLNTKLQIQKSNDGKFGLLQPVSSADEHDRFNADFKADPVGRKLIATLGSGANTTKENESRLEHVHLVISLLKRWLLGTHQGAVTPMHLSEYLDEFAFRFNRRTSMHRGKLFHWMIQQAVTMRPKSIKEFYVSSPRKDGPEC